MGLSAASKQAVSQPSARESFFLELTSGLTVIRAELDVVSIDAESKARGRLLERLGNLCVRAASLELSLLAEELSACRATIQGVAVLGHMDDEMRKHVDGAVDRIEAFVEAEREREPQVAPDRQSDLPGRCRHSVHGTIKVTVVGGGDLCASLLAEDWAAEDGEAPALHVDAINCSTVAHHDVAARTPEVVIVDADDDGTMRLVERLMSSDETEAMPIIVVGKWERVEDASAFIALGVARTIPKPVSPSALRHACLEVAPAPASKFDPLGALTIDELGIRLAAEVHRGICDAASDHARRNAVDLGSGSNVLTVMWDAIARIRELVTAQTKGSVRFAPRAPIDALPKAAWLRGSTRRRPNGRATKLHENRGDQSDNKHALVGCTVVVAEDDLSTNWFISGVLKEAGAKVISVYDGHKALDHAYRELPDLVLSDVVMPELDGYTLCRAIKRDVLLRSVPVVLLSWKADLLQRMRELGAGADGYMLKEASAPDVLQRALEVLRPRRAVADRIGEGGTVRGRLDGLTAHALLKLVCDLRTEARVSIRDANFLYEILLRGGRPVMATRSNDDGHADRGAPVMSALVGIGDGRFSIAPIEEGAAFSAELDGTFEEQMLRPIAVARAAQALISGPRLMRVDKVIIDEERLEMQMLATPEPSRGLLRALSAGASPRELVAGGRSSSELLERVLSDAARQGALREVLGESGFDMLPEAVDRELNVLSGDADDEVVRASHAALTGAVIMNQLAPFGADDPPDSSPLFEESDVESSAPVEVISEDEHDDELYDEEDELSGPLGPSRDAMYGGINHTPVLASAVEVAEHARHHTPIGSRVAEHDDPTFARLADDEPEPAQPEAAAEPEPADLPRPKSATASREPKVDQGAGTCTAPADPKPTVMRSADGTEMPPPREPAFTASDGLAEEAPKVPRLPMPSAWATRGTDAPKPKSSSRWLVPLMFGVIGIALAIGARWYREHQPSPVTPPQTQPPAAQPQQINGLPAPPTPPSKLQSTDQLEPDAAKDKPVELPLSDKDAAKLKKNEGLLEIVAGRDNEVSVDGTVAGMGPVVKVALAQKDEPYEIRVKMRGEERVRYVHVQPGKRLRLRVAPPWSR